MTTTITIKFILFVSLIFTIYSCSNNSGSNNNKNSYDNPFEYCKSIGSIDKPGSEYTGPQVPDIIAEELKKDSGAPDTATVEDFKRGTTWRCMDGKVSACFVGANIPCDEKADTSNEPNEGMVNYCKSNPDSEFIPAYASGRTTVYEWKCSGGKTIIGKQIVEVDKAGYQKSFWYKIHPDKQYY